MFALGALWGIGCLQLHMLMWSSVLFSLPDWFSIYCTWEWIKIWKPWRSVGGICFVSSAQTTYENPDCLLGEYVLCLQHRLHMKTLMVCWGNMFSVLSTDLCLQMTKTWSAFTSKNVFWKVCCVLVGDTLLGEVCFIIK